MTQNDINFWLTQTWINFFQNEESCIFAEQKKYQEEFEEIISPIDNFIDPKIQEYLEKNNYFQNVLDIVEDLKENWEDIEKNYHAIVWIWEIQDYYRNKELQEKINLVLDKVIINLEKIEESKRMVTEEEEKQLDHIKRFINKRWLKKWEYSNFVENKLQIIQNLSTKIVNNTKSIENQEWYKNKIEFEDLFEWFSEEDIEKILEKTTNIQLTKWCSWNCAWCCNNALNRKELWTYLSWGAIKRIIDWLSKKNEHVFYFASDPLDWFDEKDWKNYADLSEYYFEKFWKYPTFITKIPDKKYSLEAFEQIVIKWELWGFWISITIQNIDRIKNIILNLKEKYWDLEQFEKFWKIQFFINTDDNKRPIKFAQGFDTFLEYIEEINDEEYNITDLSYDLWKKYNYNNKEKLLNFHSKNIIPTITPSWSFNYYKIPISPFFPEWYKVRDFLNNKYLEENIYEILVNLILANEYSNDYTNLILFMEDSNNGIKKIWNYFKNNPAHKIFFKKKFEKLMDTKFFEENSKLFELLY